MIKQFKVGQRFSYEGLFGGSFTGFIVDRTDDSITVREGWTAEDTWENCSAIQVYPVKLARIPGTDVYYERVELWEYRGDKGYESCIDFDEWSDIKEAWERGETTAIVLQDDMIMFQYHIELYDRKTHKYSHIDTSYHIGEHTAKWVSETIHPDLYVGSCYWTGKWFR